MLLLSSFDIIKKKNNNCHRVVKNKAFVYTSLGLRRCVERVLIFFEGLMKKALNYFSKKEIILWLFSTICIVTVFFIFDRTNYLILSASIIGVTSLIFNAKGNAIGQGLMIIFSILYGIISYTFAYYGEMITYLGMTAPMAVFALIAWLKNPYKGNKAEVKVNTIKKKEWIIISIVTILVTIGFYFILKAFDTANLIPSTISVTTSFIAVYLTFRRSAWYAIGYAVNDIVLIVLWILASIESITYISVVICFAVFLINDLYGFISWQKMRKRQNDKY